MELRCTRSAVLSPTFRPDVSWVAIIYHYLVRKFDFTVRIGTILEHSHVPLDKWLHTIYLMVTSRKGILSLHLSKEIGVPPSRALHRSRPPRPRRLHAATARPDPGVNHPRISEKSHYYGSKASTMVALATDTRSCKSAMLVRGL